MGDNDFPTVMANGGRNVGFLREYLRGMSDYSQAGTDIPDFRLQEKYAQEQGGPLVGEQLISMDPSFTVFPPDIDSPGETAAIEAFKQRNPGGVRGRTWDQIQRDMPLIRAKLGLKGV